MGELTDVTDLLEEIKQGEAELGRAKSKLGKKELVTQVNSLQGLVIKYQREAITTLLRIQQERDRIGSHWEGLVEGVAASRAAVKEVEELLGEFDSKTIAELEKQVTERDRVIGELTEEVALLRLRVKDLVGG